MQEYADLYGFQETTHQPIDDVSHISPACDDNAGLCCICLSDDNKDKLSFQCSHIMHSNGSSVGMNVKYVKCNFNFNIKLNKMQEFS